MSDERHILIIKVIALVSGAILFGLMINAEISNYSESNSICIGGECGFELGCVKEVDVEIKVENGVRVINQNCILEGWVRDTEYYKGLKEAGYRRANVVFD